MAEKRALGEIGDWPWVRPGHLRSLLGIGTRRLAQLLQRLAELDLVAAVMIEGRHRLVLTDAGIGYAARRGPQALEFAATVFARTRGRTVLARRDRAAGAAAPAQPGAHRVGPLVERVAGRTGPAQVAQLDPPCRASRYFRHQGGMRSICPDALGVLRSQGEDWPFFLEWEGRAVRPATMRARLAPYLRCYDTGRLLEDHGPRPAVLVVFEDELAAGHFLRLAAEEVQQAKVAAPLLVSYRRALEESGALGCGWRQPPLPPF